MNETICITSVGFTPPYVEQLHRQYESIMDVYSDSGSVKVIHWEDILPPGSRPFLDSLYGFKPYAVKYAREQGYERILFLDPACYLTGKIDYLFELGLPVVAVKDDSLLKDTISDKALSYYGRPEMTLDDLEPWHLVGGSMYAFNFNHSYCDRIFSHWMGAEQANIFGSQWEASNDKIRSHRYDESAMSMALYLNGGQPISNIEAKYNCDGGHVMKKHFK